MKLSTSILSSNCPLCKTKRSYKTRQGWVNGLDKPCLSCSNSLKAGGPGNVVSRNGKKVCIGCNIHKETGKFYKYKTGRIHSYCKICSNDKSRMYHRSLYKYQKYGITEQDYQQMRELQSDKCKVCGNVSDELCIDHDHATMVIRGLLCRTCNMAIGLLYHNTEIFRKAIRYLESDDE